MRLIQNIFDGSGHWPRSKKEALIKQVARETSYSDDAVSHVMHQLEATHYKRNWPMVVTRKEAGLPEIDDLDVISLGKETVT